MTAEADIVADGIKRKHIGFSLNNNYYDKLEWLRRAAQNIDPIEASSFSNVT